jgi:hypothetical protein
LIEIWPAIANLSLGSTLHTAIPAKKNLLNQTKCYSMGHEAPFADF